MSGPNDSDRSVYNLRSKKKTFTDLPTVAVESGEEAATTRSTEKVELEAVSKGKVDSSSVTGDRGGRQALGADIKDYSSGVRSVYQKVLDIKGEQSRVIG